jgi:ubiquinone/menaquinone biosynthesis C-methylase UbiE
MPPNLWRLFRTGKGPMDGWVAHVYDRGFQTSFRGAFRALAGEVLGELAGARRILDVGCGPGQFTVMAAEALPDADVWGVDLAPTMVALAQRHAAASRAAPRLHFEVADVARLPFPDGNFDAVLSTGSIKHWPDQVAGLAEIHRVLRRDGHAFVAEVNRLAPPVAVAAQRARLGHWFLRLIYPRVLSQGLSPAEARAVFAASPFRGTISERTLLDGCLWLFETQKTRPV